MINLLHEFFNSQSDVCPLEATEQEHLENEFEKWMKSRPETFEKAAEPLIKYLAENHHPHTMATVESDGATLWEGQKRIKNEEYIVD